MSTVGVNRAGKNDALILKALKVRPGWLTERILPRLAGFPNPSSCWTWEGAKTDRGYGSVATPSSVGKRTVYVHRLMWLALRGAISPGLVLDHDGPAGCSTRHCANPEHLDVVTRQVNNAVTGGSNAAIQARQKHCKEGHPLAGDNLFAKQGHRDCKACARRRGQMFTQAAHALGLTRRPYHKLYGHSEATAKLIIAGGGK